jgi:hypothetical protein
MKKLLLLMLLPLLLSACGNRTAPNAGASVGANDSDSTELTYPVYEEDSIDLIEGDIPHATITASELLGLPEVHVVEELCFRYNNFERAKEEPEYADCFLATHRDSAAMRLANRVVNMAGYVRKNGDYAMNHLQWTIAVNLALKDFRKDVPGVSADSAIYEITGVMDRFSTLTQFEMNMLSHVESTVEDFQTVNAYRLWLKALPSIIKPLAQEEFESWFDFNEARYYFWSDVTYNQEWYSAKPLEYNAYFIFLEQNRRAELNIERDIILKGKSYAQKGSQVTQKQWEDWIAERSVTEGLEYVDADQIPSDTLVANRVNKLKATFSRWMAARQAIASALPKDQKASYEHLTTDIHCRIIETLPPLIPCPDW